MSSPRVKTCRFFTRPGGCRKGNRCPDEHGKPNKGRDDVPASAGRSSGQKPPRAPGGKCDFYWSTGTCKKAFGCKFEHVLSPDVSRARSNTTREEPDQLENTAMPYLSLSGLSDLSVSGGDAFRDSMTGFNPQETQQYLRTFLKEGFNFSTPAQMCSFGKLLSGASSLNKSWSVADGQLLLEAIATDNGCLRLSSILSYESVSSTSRFDPKILSFQRGYLPVFRYLSSKFVVKSTLSHHVNAVYAVLHNNLNQVLLHLDACITVYMTAKSFKEKPSSPESSGATIFGPIVTVFYEYLSRFKTALATDRDLGPFVAKLSRWIEEWADDITSPNPMFDDVLASSEQRHACELVSNHIKDRAHRMVSIIEREQAGMDRSAARKAAQDVATASQADAVNLLRAIENYYEGPGEETRDGPRHDNDFVDIRRIKLAPTDQELTCPLVPFLPVNLPNAPHPFPKDSMQRLLDIQFRLLREELLAPLRTSVQVVLDDLQAPSSRKTQLAELKSKKGGRYNYQDRQDSVMFNVYTNVSFSRIEVDSRRGPVVELQFDTPPGSARSNKAGIRAAYWANGKRLMHGGLIALLWKRSDHIDVHLGILCSAADKLAEAAKKSDDRLPIRVQFFDAAVNFKVLEHFRSKNKPKDERLLVESSVMFETIRPFLESLQRVPETIPFSTYLPHPLSGSLEGTPVHPPAYSRVPGFSFNLGDLRRPEDEDGLRGLRLVTTDPVSIRETRVALAERSRLDPSQAEAMMDTLTREIALIQGPPGTGKTFIGVELIRVLIKNNVGPILLIAFTNHALDHMLSSIIEKGITNDVVRLGGRSTEESIKRYSIEEIERVSGRTFLDRSMKSEFRAIKETEEEITKLLGHVIGTSVPSSMLLRHVSMFSPDHVAHLEEPPLWIRELHASHDSHEESTWQEAGPKKRRIISDSSLYAFWKAGQDLKFLRDAQMQKGVSSQPSAVANRFNVLLHGANESTEGNVDQLADTHSDVVSDKDEDGDSLSDDPEEAPALTDAEVFLLAHGEVGIPEEPTSDRPIETLLENENCSVWTFSQSERLRIDSYWVTQFRESAYESQKMRFEDLIEGHSNLRQKQRNRDEEIRLNIIRNRRLIGCTTTGAAKLISLLKGFAPRVMIVEEAGQVLESHILASLVDSVEHLVLIGDPLQLRPTLNNFALSMDNPRGEELYRFDMSLMERLSKTGFPMSRLDVQRRMRPEISCLIRDFLYPKLQDHGHVLEYGSIRGMDKDVFFLSHGHKEHGGGDDSVSKHNPYEVSMIRTWLNICFGCYSSEGNIVILCTYLGQLAKVRDALKAEVTVVIDERDQDALDQQEGEEAIDTLPIVERVQVTQRVKIRSVDNYQGEEADIIILSLVRNSGGGHETNEHDIVSRRTVPRIGFLKSENRTNVALSRARQGLYILGNASDLASKSSMWSSVISQLDNNGAVGDAIPIKCHRHPEDIRYISNPGELPKVSPDGGCLRGCNRRLTCGHTCPYKCHADDEAHRNVFCIQPCPKLCPKGHPCPKQCGDPCGNCKHPIRDVRLPCGHIHKSVPCHQMDDLSEIKCMVKVERKLPTCEHSAILSCSYEIEKHKCQALCDGILPCCGKSCKARCHSCQDPPADGAELHAVPRTRHRSHTCGRPLYCEHECHGICSADHKCINECEETCRQSCSHAQCRLPCSTPCAPCQEPCAWVCPHYTCPVPCGSVCARLPCDSPCERMLRCGHRCPSVCGEDCAIQICLTCAPKERLSEIADLIMQRPLSDLDPSQGSIDELVITLPGCKHTFTVETLDGHCHMSEYYEGDGNGAWRSLKSPTSGFKPPPVCPTCRRAIRSPRYGRVYKRADLDILERNVTSRLIKSLRTVSDDFQSVDLVVLRRNIQGASGILHDVAPGAGDEDKIETRENARRKILNNDMELPVLWEAIDPRKEFHGIGPVIARRWLKEVQKVKKLYDRALEIASARSAHVKAWEAAFSSLYRQEIESAVQEPSTAPRHLAEYAMRVAKMKVGLSKPLADKRFCVEALWLTISIRHLLASVAQEWLTRKTPSPPNFSSFRVTWSSFIAFILKTCERDAEVALRVAESTQSHKQALRSKVLIFNTRLETLKFDCQLYRDAVPGAKTRDDLKEAVSKQLDDLNASVDAVDVQYRRSGSARMEAAEFKRFFLSPIDGIRKELGDLEETIRTGVMYSPVTYEEKQQIVAALMKSYDLVHSGHYYQCPNGHPFVIGDCGGATETARCPECFELIGGSGHSLLSTNRRDNELEEIARRGGVQRSPWPWAA